MADADDARRQSLSLAEEGLGAVARAWRVAGLIVEADMMLRPIGGTLEIHPVHPDGWYVAILAQTGGCLADARAENLSDALETALEEANPPLVRERRDPPPGGPHAR